MPDLTKARCPCRGCNTVATNAEQVEKLFGLRNMGDGTVRVQSYCRECRSLHCEASDPKCN
ncbi:hemagglutinin [Vibrio parahaemolyticus]|uniref:hemagglutinin n=1 Tax=Vibrio diabolicus TaxID=50719 RepID=UPI0009A7D8DD|nr:hemagglutinin [Vibrio diabolicus]EGR0036464.1 hemagglutinin [Vibrio parahaemolyticus]OQS92157.1 hemagglutinin [Vibrio parahaemolyticus 98-513-F52]EGR0204812.1 hemagglutinin [Vibrio parahaemolyticus]EGR0257250.1 hemagglutinin [Vibrio parahaemolyticus]EGR2293521.1 hemagglutinin [Vibrio parahaemolyticus]